MQGSNQLAPPSPRKESLSGADANLAKFSILGQQLKQFLANMPQQHHQNRSGHSSSLGFSLGVNSQGQGHSHSNHSQSVLNNDGGNHMNGGSRGGERGGGNFQHLQQGNVGPHFNQQQVGGQMANQSMPDNNLPQSVVEQNVQGLMNHLSMLQQKITQLQALVPLISQTAHCQSDANVVVAQQQAASAAVVSIISQLAMAASGFLPQQFTNQGNQVSQSTELPLSQLLQAAVSPGLNIFQQNGIGNMMGTPRNNPVLGNSMGNSFGTAGAGAGAMGGAHGNGSSAGTSSLAFPSGGGGGGYSGLGNEGELSGHETPSVEQTGGGGTSGAMLQNQMSVRGGKQYGSIGGRTKGGGGGSGPANTVGNSIGAGGGASSYISHDSGTMNPGLDELENDSRLDDEDSDGGNLSPGSFDLVEMDAMEILAEHTHFCEICGKGFKRDANLRMHMRGHGDEYKTPAALARPDRATQDIAVVRSRRYSCPYVGCKRNKKHRKFQPLKTMLCVKNHYRRSHCPKVLTCQKCKAKKFSVVADLKTHEKHCGRDKWQCSCGTTFSRKDKLFGHIGLFVGHTPAMPLHEMEGGGSGMDHQESPSEAFGSGSHSGAGFLSGSGNVDDFGSSGSGLGAGNGLEMALGNSHGGIGLGLGSRGNSGGLSLSDEGGPSLSGFTF